MFATVMQNGKSSYLWKPNKWPRAFTHNISGFRSFGQEKRRRCLHFMMRMSYEHGRILSDVEEEIRIIKDSDKITHVEIIVKRSTL